MSQNSAQAASFRTSCTLRRRAKACRAARAGGGGRGPMSAGAGATGSSGGAAAASASGRASRPAGELRTLLRRWENRRRREGRSRTSKPKGAPRAALLSGGIQTPIPPMHRHGGTRGATAPPPRRLCRTPGASCLHYGRAEGMLMDVALPAGQNDWRSSAAAVLVAPLPAAPAAWPRPTQTRPLLRVAHGCRLLPSQALHNASRHAVCWSCCSPASRWTLRPPPAPKRRHANIPHLLLLYALMLQATTAWPRQGCTR